MEPESYAKSFSWCDVGNLEVDMDDFCGNSPKNKNAAATNSGIKIPAENEQLDDNHILTAAGSSSGAMISPEKNIENCTATMASGTKTKCNDTATMIITNDRAISPK